MVSNVKVQDNPIAAMLDSLSSLQFFEKSNKLSALNNTSTNNFAKNFVPSYSDDIYRDRFSQLEKTSPIPLVYNRQVKDMIDLYAVKKHTLTEHMLGLAQLYFPMIEELLDRYGIPLEMKYLAIVESALNPIAKSHVGAGGLWQFMYATGKQYNLDVNSYVDDRNDPYDATIAACKYLNDLYKIHKDWLLVMAAYNCGSNNVTKAIRRSGGKTNFWEISPYLPKETQAYVPAFIAVTYVMNHASDHNLIPILPIYKNHEVDTVLVKNFLTFNQLSEKLNVSKDELLFLNPAFRKGVIPSSSQKSYTLRLPKRCIPDFINNEAALYAYTEKKEKINFEKPLAKKGKELYTTKEGNQYHKVKSGESLALLSEKYNTTVAQLKEWNGLNGKGNILVGQRLIVNKLVKTQNETMLASKSESGNKDSHNQTPVKTYTVKKGDTYSSLAAKHAISIDDLKALNSKMGNNLVIGQKIVISGPLPHTENENLAQKDNSSGNNKQQLEIKYITYKVQPGDTLLDIANRNQISIYEIKKWNNLKNEDIVPGQKIKIRITT
jgi:membrane-bound lytic murein transglycosylase D